jgi:hypothetical protein
LWKPAPSESSLYPLTEAWLTMKLLALLLLIAVIVALSLFTGPAQTPNIEATES